MRQTIAFAVALLLSASTILAHNWPAFRGPDGQGHSDEAHLPADWSETKNVAWKTPVAGLGWSSPVVADGRVWLTSAIEGAGRNSDMSLRALAFDVATG